MSSYSPPEQLEYTFHIGMPKTGTTTLQDVVFPRLKDVHYCNGLRRLSWLYRQEYRSGKILISAEDLVGPILFARYGYYPDDYTAKDWLDRMEVTLTNLRLNHPQARVILVIRKPAEFIGSLYRQYLHQKGTLRFQEFFDIDQDKGLIKRHELAYVPRLRLLEREFPGRFLLLDFEQYKRDFQGMLNTMLHFMGVPSASMAEVLPGSQLSRQNEGVRHRQAEWLRQLNRLNHLLHERWNLFSLYNPYLDVFRLTPRDICVKYLAFLSAKKLTLPPGVKEKIDAYYEADWAEVSGVMEAHRARWQHVEERPEAVVSGC